MMYLVEPAFKSELSHNEVLQNNTSGDRGHMSGCYTCISNLPLEPLYMDRLTGTVTQRRESALHPPFTHAHVCVLGIDNGKE